MIIERDLPITMDDGVVIRADVYRPKDDKPAPVVMAFGPYGKGVPYRVGYKAQYQWLVTTYPHILPGSTREFLTWETVDPEVWVPWGYACVRIDQRGSGRSPGYMDIFSPREIKDYYNAIEWAGQQAWSTGKVGLNGISYYAINQWLVASLQPPHLTAMIPWEGAADNYRDMNRHGGIQSNAFIEAWYPRQVVSVQHGNPKGVTDPWMNERATGPATLSDEELAKNRSDPIQDVFARPLDCEFYRERSPEWSKVTVPFLSAASWAGFGLHPRGNFEAFTQAASKQKWLECHPGRHEEWFYLDREMAMQKRFFDHFLKGEDNGWDKEPPVLLNLRRPFSKDFEQRREHSWPLAKTKWTKTYLDASKTRLSSEKASSNGQLQFEALKNSITIMSEPLDEDMEITGPLAAKLFACSSTTDMDLFITFQAFSPNGKEVEFQGTVDPHTPLAQGWLRASHRKLNTEKSLPYRPYHTHDELQPLEPGKVYELDIEIWPTNILLPAGYKIALRIEGKDFERELPPDVPNEAWVARGSGPFMHTSKKDRPEDVFGGTTTIVTGPETPSYLLLPAIEN